MPIIRIVRYVFDVWSVKSCCFISGNNERNIHFFVMERLKYDVSNHLLYVRRLFRRCVK